MKTLFKFIIGFIILAAIIWLAFVIYNHFHKAAVEKGNTELAAAVKNNFAVKPVDTFTDKTGARHSQYDLSKNVFTKSSIASRKDSTMGGPDTTAQILKIQREQIESWRQAAVTYQARALKAENSKDSLGHLVRYYKNKYVEIAFHEPTTTDSADHGTFDYKAHLNVTTTDYYKSKFLLWKYNPVTDVSIDDPDATINGYRSFAVEQQPNTFNIKARVRAVYNFATGRVTPSTGIEVNAGRFDLGGMYFFNTRLQKLTPALSVSYNFLQLHK